MIRRWQARVARDGGFTLTELLVVITLTGIIGMIVVAAVTTGLHKQTQVQDRSDALAQARTALQRVDRDVRSSNPLVSATDTEITLCEVQPGGTTLVRYQVDPGTGTMKNLDVYTATVSSCGATMPVTTAKVLLGNLVNTTASPVFRYAPVAGYTAPASGTAVNATTCATAGFSPAAYDPHCIGTVTVTVQAQPGTLAQPISVSDNGTDLRNPA